MATKNEEHTAHLDGLDMHYAMRGEGPPLVLLHGFFGSSGDWIHLFDLEALAREYRVIMPDLRGHGRSSNPADRLTMRQCATDVIALLDSIGVDRFKAVGVSLGGNALLHVATRQPARVEAMILAGSPSYFPDQARAIMRTVTPETRTDDEWRLMRARHHRGDDQIRALWQHARALADHHDDMCFTPPELATIQARTLIINGDRDPLYPLSIFVEQSRSIPRAALWIIPNGGHAPVFGDARPEVERIGLAFLRAPPTA